MSARVHNVVLDHGAAVVSVCHNILLEPHATSSHVYVCFEVWHVASTDFGGCWSIQQSVKPLLIQLKHKYAVSDIELGLDVAKACAPDESG